MLGLARGKQGLKLIRGYRRFISSPSISISEDIAENESIKTTSTSGIKHPKIKHILSQASSDSYLSTLTTTTFNRDTNQSNNQAAKIKKEIYRLVDNKSYTTLMDVLLQWSTSTSSSITAILSQEEISYLIKQIIGHQVTLMHHFSINTPVEKAKRNMSLTEKLNKASQDPNFIHARQLITKIRDFYSNLIYSSPNESIYSRDKSLDLYESESSTGYKLTVKDYENLIYMELHNFKLDLASKWFQRFEAQFGGEHFDHMSYNMWILKFQVYAGGLPSHWVIGETELASSTFFNPRQGPINFEVPFEAIYKEFMLYNLKRKSPKLVLNNSFISTMIYSMGYSKKVDLLLNFIETKWGISKDGTLTGPKLPLSHPNYPDVAVLRSIMIALSYNGKFFEALKYINSFQDTYHVKVSGPKAKSFWQDIFKWCDINTKFESRKALQYFVSHSQDMSMSKKYKNQKSLSLQEAQKNANFDYSGYLQFIKGLHQERSKGFELLWELYQKSNGVFSRYIYKRYIDFINEGLDPENTEALYYGLLTSLLQEHQKYHLSKWSFNKRDVHLNQVNNIDDAIYSLYIHAMKSFVDYKCRELLAGQCGPLIDKWSIDTAMKESLHKWFTREKYPQYREMVEKKREEFMVKLRGEGEGEDDRFLDLI